jgi:hypothetical protein
LPVARRGPTFALQLLAHFPCIVALNGRISGSRE